MLARGLATDVCLFAGVHRGRLDCTLLKDVSLLHPLLQELKKRHEEEKNRLEQLFLKEQAGRREDQVGCQSRYDLLIGSQVLRLSAESNLSKIQTELSRLREYELVIQIHSLAQHDMTAIAGKKRA